MTSKEIVKQKFIEWFIQNYPGEGVVILKNAALCQEVRSKWLQCDDSHMNVYICDKVVRGLSFTFSLVVSYSPYCDKKDSLQLGSFYRLSLKNNQTGFKRDLPIDYKSFKKYDYQLLGEFVDAVLFSVDDNLPSIDFGNQSYENNK